jgi:TolA-binding protein
MSDPRAMLTDLRERLAVQEARSEELEKQLHQITELNVKQAETIKTQIAAIESKLDAHAKGSVERAEKVLRHIATGFVRIEEFKTYRWMLQLAFGSAITGLIAAVISLLTGG